MDLGFDRAGLVCKWQCEIDEYARAVLRKHWPEVPKHDDIRTFRNPPKVDIIAGGFPCQDVSNAGLRAGIRGERSGLFWELMRVVREVEPRYVVLENVAALLVRGMGEVLRELAASGYDAEWDCLPASAFGAHFRVAARELTIRKRADRNSRALHCYPSFNHEQMERKLRRQASA